MLIKEREEHCNQCQRKFIVKRDFSPSNINDKAERETYIFCPYCNRYIRDYRLEKNEIMHCIMK